MHRLYRYGWIISGILIGLKYGAIGVALGYSIATFLMMLPLAYFSVKGTFLGLDDYWKPIARPLAFSLISGLFSFIMYDVLYESLQPILVLFSVTASMLIPYAFLTMKWNREFVNYATRVFF